MAETSQTSGEGDAEDTDELLNTDLDEEDSVCRGKHPPMKLDHCDMLLDAIDVQLSRMHVQNQVHGIKDISGKHNSTNSAPPSWSRCVSKDTGLGSTTQSNNTLTSGPDLNHSETKDQSTERSLDCSSVRADREQRTEGRMRDEEEERGAESRREQCLWRLERLLGNGVCDRGAEGGITGGLCPPPDSVCTEDFASRFKQEMVGLPPPERCESRQVSDRPDSLEDVSGVRGDERTDAPPDSDSSQTDGQERKDLPTVSRGECVRQGGRRRNAERIPPTERLHHQHVPEDKPANKDDREKSIGHPGQRDGGLRAGWRDHPECGDSIGHPGQRDGGLRAGWRDHPECGDSIGHPGQRDGLRAGWRDHPECGEMCLSAEGLVSCPASNSSDTEALVELKGTGENKKHASRTRSLAGVPVWSFDTVTIDSDLDSVRTEDVRQHIYSRPGCRSAIQSVSNVDGLCTEQSDYDIPAQEPREALYTSVLRSGNINVSHGSLPPHKPRHSKRQSARSARCGGEDEENSDEGYDHRRRRRCRATPGGLMEPLRSEEELSALTKSCEKEEERLRMKRTQLCETERSLSEVLHKRKNALQELEQLQGEVEQMERQRQSVEASLRDSRVEADSTSCQLRRLQRQRDTCAQQVRDLEEELTTLSQRSDDELYVEKRYPGVSVSVLEREEMVRQLHSAKTELFTEQRLSRIKMESLQEKLEEACEELQLLTEDERTLRNKCADLEEKQRQKQEQTLGLKSGELQKELEACGSRIGALERILAQKELHLLGYQEERSALETEKAKLQGEIQSLKAEHMLSLREAQDEAERELKRKVEQLNEEMTTAHEKQIRHVHQQSEEEKAAALREQARSHTQQTEFIQSCIQVKEEEGRRLREDVEQQKEVMIRREEELHAEAAEKVHSAIEGERRKWEAEMEDALQVQRGTLEEQSRQTVETAVAESERERRNALTLQNKVVDLQTRVQEVENESHTQQREQESALATLRRSLRGEHQAELLRLRRHMEQEGKREVLELEEAVVRAEEEAGRLQRALAERESSQRQTTARLEQQLRHWALELGAECQHLHLLMERSGAPGSTLLLPHSPTVAQAVQNLQALREQLQQFITSLQQELDSQRLSTQQLSRDKEFELRVQKEQMRLEREQALDSLKERLIQEHIEELSSLNRTQGRVGVDEAGGVSASLRRQLQAKDQELREVQRSMVQWKEQTTARLALKFEEELTTELERKPPNEREEKQRKLEKLEEEMRRISEDSTPMESTPVCSRESATSAGPSDMASFKLLRHLQSRVRQLRAENQAFACTPSPVRRTPLELAGSYLETIPPSKDCSQLWSRPAIRAVPI